MNSLNCANGH